MISIEISDQKVNQALEKLIRSVENTHSVLELIGEQLVASTKRRFSTSTAPDGSRWASNSHVTILRYLGEYKSSFSKKDGRITKKGTDKAIAKRPLIGKSGDLSREISYEIEDNHTLYIGSSMIYAAVQQFGAEAKQFGKAPWGDIPARPFLGLSDRDQSNILDTISDYLSDSFVS